ncbi:Uma2 family endonuclease [Planomonospora corallina]|uniref:Uma2 family endonuclease n=1 Tax=Planomonospora corallina TaxID=1806052 RepID=A0ABV8I1Q5_9ACTN
MVISKPAHLPTPSFRARPASENTVRFRRHEDVTEIDDQIRAHHLDLRTQGARGLVIPAYRTGRAIPDGTVAPKGNFRGQPEWADPAGVVMLLEVTSSEPDVDRVEKLRAYAEAAIPIYLLVDRERCEVVVHWDPESGHYTRTARAESGKPLDLPAPLSSALDTSGLS